MSVLILAIAQLEMISRQLPNWAEAVTALFSAATLLAVVLAAIQIRHVNQQMHRELEMQYLLRFWALTDRQSKRYKRRGIPTQGDRAVFRDYLSLSEDQIELRSLGRVTNHTWQYWRKDIRSMCLSDSVFGEMSKAPKSDYPHVRRLLAQPDYDPLEEGRIWKHFKGL